jgi:hypothetical protein
MATVNTLEVKIVGDDSNLQSTLSGAASSISKFAVASIAIYSTVTNSLSKFVTETVKAQNEQAQLNAVLLSTGKSAGFNADQLNKMAEAMSKVSTFGAGDILTAQTRLLSYTNIMGQQFPAAMQAVIDMSARLGMSMEQSAETIGRALDIPSQGLTALSRQGFRFTESQKELAKELEETGRTAEAQQMILDALTSAYGGAALAARNTLGGALSELRESFNTLFTISTENSGFLATAIGNVTTALKIMNGEVKTSADLFERMFPAYQKFREQMDKEMGVSQSPFSFGDNFVNLPKPSGQFLEILDKQAESFRKNNPLNDQIAKSETLKLKLAEINKLYEHGAITLQEKNRYISQFNKEYQSIATVIKDAEGSQQTDTQVNQFVSELERRKEALRHSQMDEMGIESDKYAQRLEQLRTFLEENRITHEQYNALLEEMSSQHNDVMANLSTEKDDGALEKFREAMDARLEKLRETQLTEEELEQERYLLQLEQLALFFEDKTELEEEYRMRREQLEEEHADRMVAIAQRESDAKAKIQQDVERFIQNQQLETFRLGIGLMQQFGRQNKAFAIATIAIEKGLAIALAIQNTAVAVTKALAIDPTGRLAARAAALGKVQVGIIAATGLAQAASVGRGGASDGTAGGVPIMTQDVGGGSIAGTGSFSGTSSNQVVNINLTGEVFGREQVRTLITEINEAVADGAVLRVA